MRRLGLLNRLEDHILEICKKASGEKAFWWRGTWWSRNVLSEMVTRCRDTLKSADFGEGQILAVIMPNCPLFLSLAVAVWSLKGTLLPLNLQAGRLNMAKHLQHAGVSLAVMPEGMESVAEDLTQMGVLTVTAPLEGPLPSVKVGPNRSSNAETAILFYTSGTTGSPKAVPLTHANLLDNVTKSIDHFMELQPGDRFLNVLPNFHALGFTTSSLLPLLGGFPQVILPNFMPAENTLAAILEAEVTVVIAVPTMIALMLGAIARGAEIPTSLRILVSGGDKFPPLLDQRIQKILRIGVLEGYGLTETSPVVSINPGQKVRKLGTVGTILKGYEVQIRDKEGNIIKDPETEGILWLKGPSVFGGYFKDPQRTAERIKDGWFNTGDIVKVDENGYLSILDRESDIIIVGGFNVYPAEVEEVIQSNPGVSEAAVVGIAHPVSGEIVKAYVVKRPGTSVQSRDIISYCKERLAHYKVPRVVEFVDDLPRSSIGKVLRRELRNR